MTGIEGSVGKAALLPVASLAGGFGNASLIKFVFRMKQK